MVRKGYQYKEKYIVKIEYKVLVFPLVYFGKMVEISGIIRKIHV